MNECPHGYDGDVAVAVTFRPLTGMSSARWERADKYITVTDELKKEASPDLLAKYAISNDFCPAVNAWHATRIDKGDNA